MRLIAVTGGVAALAALIAYLVIQATASTGGDAAANAAELDDSADLPGTFVPSQGGRHLSYGFTLSHTPVPYCDGVAWSGATPVTATATPTATATATPSGTATGNAARQEPTPRDDCYASNPPSSGPMIGGGSNVEVVPGVRMNLPPAPNVYPRDVDIPREAITHSLEHAGVFIGYNCPQDDQACWDVVGQIEDIANNRIDNNDDRVSMGYFSDLLPGEIGLSAWTRNDRFMYTEFEKKRVEKFISTHSCRYDEEKMC